jgi:N-acetylglucosamine-6-phosphate deacetylase
MNQRVGRVLLDGGLVAARVRFERGRISAVERLTERAGELPVIAPGLVDLHVHGYGGHGPLDDLARMASALARAGTTAFVPTLFPAAPERLGEICARLGADMVALRVGPGRAGRARALGIHLEGPFVNPRAAGALPVSELAEPTPAGLRAILGPASGDGRAVRIVTLAPELTGSAPLVAELARSGVRVSLGHSLCTSAEACAAARAGASGATHLFNAMSGVHHRAMGLAGYALSSDALVAEIIGDLVHVGPEAWQLALRARGPRGLALVSDALAGAGSGCDVFQSHGHRIVLRDGAAWIDDPRAPAGTPPRLAGAAAPQLEAVRRLVRSGTVGLADALVMASETPARALGLEGEVGRIAVGARADLLVLRGDVLELEEVLIDGEVVA